jgi:hypothetical protein
MPKLNRNWVASQKSADKDMVPYPYANCKVKLERLDPAMLEALQTQKKEVSKRIRKYTEETREHHRKSNRAYSKRKRDGFNLLKKWVPGTKTLSHPDILKTTVNYIKELLNKVNEKESLKESTPLTACETGMETDISDMVASTPMEIGASEEIQKSVSPDEEEELFRSPDEEEELLVSPEEQELLKCIAIEELRKWLEL